MFQDLLLKSYAGVSDNCKMALPPPLPPNRPTSSKQRGNLLTTTKTLSPRHSWAGGRKIVVAVAVVAVRAVCCVVDVVVDVAVVAVVVLLL